MPLLALALLVAAAIFHTTWNLLLKQAGEKYIAIWWAALVGTVIALPLPFLGKLPALEIWPYVLLSALAEVAYMATLASAYDLGDFSLVYPIARGAAPGFLVIWSVLFLKEHLSGIGAAGLAVLIAGLLVVGSSDWLRRRGQERPDSDSMDLQKAHAMRLSIQDAAMLKNIALALLVALLISTYSAIDGAAVKHTDPTPYTILVIGLTGPLFTPFVLRRHDWATIWAVWRAHWRRVILIGILSLLAYALVTNAYAITQVSYAGAIREISVVFAALAGWRLLGEDLGKVRIFGALMIFSGILLIALAQ